MFHALVKIISKTKRREYNPLCSKASLVNRDSWKSIVTIQIKNQSAVYFEIDKPDQKKVSIEFWKVRKVSDEENSNMKIEMIEQNVSVPTMKDVGVAASSPIVVSVPSAVLTKDVQVGDELVLHVPKAEKPDKKRTLNVASKPKAKAKLSSKPSKP